MISVGIDIAKGKSTVCMLKPYGEIVCKPFDIEHVSWCEDNLEKPRASAGFLHYIKENQKRYGLIYDAKCIGNCRGFHNVCKAEFSPVIGKTPFD